MRDILRETKRMYIIAAGAAFAGCILMILNSDMAVLSAKKAISLWIKDVVPAMLPFFICVNFLGSTGIIKCLPGSIFPFVMSVLSGYPMGAKIIGDMCRTGAIDRREAMRLVSFCSTSGPVFIIGAVGVGMLGSQEAGIIAAVAHYLGAMLNGVLFTLIFPGKSCRKTCNVVISDCGLVEKFTEAIFSAFRSMGIILAYIIIFMFITDMASAAGIFEMTSSGTAECLMKGFLEMTVGCSSAAALAVSMNYRCVLAAVIISWGGLSIMGQSVSMLSGTGIPILYLMFTKLTHSIFAGIIALFIGGAVL